MEGSLKTSKTSAVLEGKGIAIPWDMPIHADKEIIENRPDIVIKERAQVYLH